MSTTLSDFVEASRHSKGVELIPFSDIRREAASIAQEVQDRKIKTTLNLYEREIANLLDKKKTAEVEIEEQKKEAEELVKKTPGFDVSYQTNKIKGFEKEIAGFDEKIKKIKEGVVKAIEERIEEFRRLQNARGGLREVFDDALDGLKDVRSNPKKYIGTDATEDDLKTLEKCLDTILGNIDNEKKDHKDQEDGARKKEEELEELIQGFKN